MQNTLAPPGAFPPWWRDRCWTLASISTIVGVPLDTLYGWFRLASAVGFTVGKKPAGQWRFDAHELYFFRMLAALAHMHHPVGVAQIKAVYSHAFGEDGAMHNPGHDGFLQMYSADKTAAVSIDAPKIFGAIVKATEPEGEYA